ncbi:MBL fold metallo-hydrolase [Endozoicomonas sp. ALB032]|uniref:MBL fold metallo-hydrolase n=1 Tax=Endozoicomonas sp. ALB032 TaxID=3403082 RepID=UPI003BB6EF11
MKITLISHACIVIHTEDIKILTDPWLFGTAFNDSWSLKPQASKESLDYENIDYLWISHEHPDHFHIPTLKTLPESFKNKVTVLYQKNNSNKMIKALKGFGFNSFEILPHREIVKLSDQTKVYCYQVGGMDSALGVMADEEVIFNINDSELNQRDCNIVKGDIGSPDVVLNQFSIAGYSGQADRGNHLPLMAKNTLINCSNNHIDLGASVTIPFASLVYFCKDDNAYMNNYHNSPLDFCEHMMSKSLDYTLLYPGDTYTLGMAFNNVASKKKYEALESNFDNTFETSALKSIEAIREAFNERFKQIKYDFSSLFRFILKPVTVEINDISKKVEFSFKDGTFSELNTTDECDLVINSQPLWFAFKFPFGIQTLGVSARYTLNKNEKNWKYYRVLCSLNNAEIYLSWKFFNKSNLQWLAARFSGIMNQLIYQLKRM